MKATVCTLLGAILLLVAVPQAGASAQVFAPPTKAQALHKTQKVSVRKWNRDIGQPINSYDGGHCHKRPTWAQWRCHSTITGNGVKGYYDLRVFTRASDGKIVARFKGVGYAAGNTANTARAAVISMSYCEYSLRGNGSLAPDNDVRSTWVALEAYYGKQLHSSYPRQWWYNGTSGQDVWALWRFVFMDGTWAEVRYHCWRDGYVESGTYHDGQG